MSFRNSLMFAAIAAAAMAMMPPSADAALIKTAGTATTSNKVTQSTSGQHQITSTIDPYNVASFQLSFSFDPGTVQFVGITGLNGYIVDNLFNVDIETGIISGIHGYYPGFNDFILTEPGASPFASPLAPLPPAGEVDIFQIVFNDLAPNLPKTFNIFAADINDYITGFDPDTNGFTTVAGPFNPQTGQGVVNTLTVLPAFGAGGSGVPLPPAVWMGLATGAGALLTSMRRKTA